MARGNERHGRTHMPGGSDPIPASAVYEIKVVSDSQLVVVASGAFIFEIPEDLAGKKLLKARAFVTTASTSGLPTVQIRNATAAADMLSTPITIDVGATSSRNATTAAVVDPAHCTVADGDQISVEITAAGSGAKGLGVILRFG